MSPCFLTPHALWGLPVSAPFDPRPAGSRALAPASTILPLWDGLSPPSSKSLVPGERGAGEGGGCGPPAQPSPRMPWVPDAPRAHVKHRSRADFQRTQACWLCILCCDQPLQEVPLALAPHLSSGDKNTSLMGCWGGSWEAPTTVLQTGAPEQGGLKVSP